MSDCTTCDHSLDSGQCLKGNHQTFTPKQTVKPALVKSDLVYQSLNTDCPDFVLSDTSKDSSDSAKDSKPEDKSNTKFDILRGVNYGLFGVGTVSALFFILNEIPSLDFITLIFCMVFLIHAVIYAYDSPVDNDQDQDGDE